MRSRFQSSVAVCLVATLLPWPAAARTRKGDVLLAKARQAEARDTVKDLDEALSLAQQALATDRADIGYQLEVARLRAFTAQYHVYEGQVFRDQGKLKEAIAEFERAVALDPASVVAPQELQRTKNMLLELQVDPNVKFDLDRPLPRKNKRDEAQFSAAAPVPTLTVKLTKPLPVIKVNNQTASEVFQAVCKEAGLRILFDPDYQNRSLGLNQTLDFTGAALDQVLDYLALATKSFWKPLSGDTILVTNDDPMRRSSFEEQVTKAMYLTNAPGSQEVNDIANTVQRVTDMKKLQVHPAQSVIIARGDADRIALAEKIVADLDKPKAEIIIDVVILSVSRNWERQLGINLIGLADNATNVLFNPRALLNPGQVGGRTGIPLDAVRQLEKGDYNVTLPGAALNALLKISGTKVMDKAQLRTIEGQKSVLRIGQRIPYATGSFSPGAFAGGSSLVNTQFQYFDVGLNIDVVAKVHEPDEVSLHIESDSSAVQDRVDLGGVLQPIISQRKRVADVRVKEGEVNFWDIVTQRQDVKASNGLPGLSQVPWLGRVFSNEKTLQSELQVLTLLIPHIIRAPDIRSVNLAGLPSGSEQTVRLRFNSRDEQNATAKPTTATLELQPGSAPPPMTTPNAAAPSPMASGAPPSPAAPGAPPAPNPTAPPTVSSARFALKPVAPQVALNSAITTELGLAEASEPASGKVAIQFDQRTLQLTGVTPAPGVTLSDDSRASGFLTFTIGSGPAMRPLATLTFRAATPGHSTIGVVAGQLLGGNGAPLSARGDTLTFEITGSPRAAAVRPATRPAARAAAAASRKPPASRRTVPVKRPAPVRRGPAPVPTRALAPVPARTEVPKLQASFEMQGKYMPWVLAR